MNRTKSLAFIGLILAAFAWRVHDLSAQSLWRDEVDAIYFATRDLELTLTMFSQTGQNGPLYFIALRPWFSLVGTTEFALRYPSAMAGVLSVAMLWQVARRLLPPVSPSVSHPISHTLLQPAVPWLAAIFLAFNPYQVWYSQEGKMYTIITFLVLLATWFWWQGIEQGGWRPWLAYLLTVTMALYTHLLIILLFPLHFVWFWIAFPQSKRHWRGYGLALAGLTLPYLPMVIWQWTLLTSTQKLTGFSFTPLHKMGQVLLYNHSRGFMTLDRLFPVGSLHWLELYWLEPLNGLEPLSWLAPIFFLGAAGLLFGVGEIGAHNCSRGGDLAPWRRYLLLLSWLVLPILTIYALSLRQPIFTDRYIIWVGPAAMLFLALGIEVIRRHMFFVPRALATGLVVYVLVFWGVGGWQQKTRDMKYDLRGGVAYIQPRRTADTLLILQIPHMEYGYRYYSSDFSPRPFGGSEARLVPWTTGLWTNNGYRDEDAWSQVERQMAEMTAGYTDVWIFRSEVEMWDARHLMDRWLNEHGTVVDQADFHGVQVRKYALNPD